MSATVTEVVAKDASITVNLKSTDRRDEDVSSELVRGDRDGRLRLQGIPQFKFLKDQRQWMKEHMAAAFRFFGKHGYNEGIAGHISMRGMSIFAMSETVS